MSDLELLLAAVWVIYGVDGTRWSRDESNALSGATGASATLRRDRLHVPWPTPWSWRVRIEEPGLSLSPNGLSSAPAPTLLSPTPPSLAPAFLPWNAFREVQEKDRRLWVNGVDFAAADPVVSTEWIQAHFPQFASSPPEGRSALVERKLRQVLSPASWRRRWQLLLRATRPVALWHSFTLASALATSALILAPNFGLPEDVAERTGEWALPFAAATLLTYLGGVVAGVRSARRLKRWLPAGTVTALLLGSLYPPQGLRWRLRLMERAMPATHPLTGALALLSKAEARPWLRRALTLWANPLSHAPSPTREWTQALLRRLKVLCGQRGLSLAELTAPPSPDGRTSVRYCPCCHAQFVRAEAACACGLPLRSFVPSDRS